MDATNHAALVQRKRDRRGWIICLCAIVALACELYPSMLGTYASEHYTRTVQWADEHHERVILRKPYDGGHVIGRAMLLGDDVLLGA